MNPIHIFFALRHSKFLAGLCIRGVFEKYLDWCHKTLKFQTTLNMVLPSIPLKSNAQLHPSLPYFHALLEEFFWNLPPSSWAS